jgi:hypothetical protein
MTLIGLALYFVLNFPLQVTGVTLFGSPLTVNAPRQWLMVLLLGGLATTGVHAVIKLHPYLSTLRLGYLATFWPLPGLLVILATQTLGLAPSPGIWAASLVVVGILLWFIILAEFHLVSAPPAAAFFWPRLWQQFVGYGLALAFFVIIYQTRSRGALSATSILLVSSLVTLALLRQKPQAIAKTWLFALVIGLCLGQLTWALNYWHGAALNAGLLLFLTFYILVGLAQQQLLGTLSRRVLWEFGAVAVVMLVVIFQL